MMVLFEERDTLKHDLNMDIWLMRIHSRVLIKRREVFKFVY